LGKGQPVTVKVDQVRPQPISRVLETTGEVVATNTITVAATVEGPLAFCPWREDDRVRAGQKLIEIDRPLYREEVTGAAAALAVARAKLDDLKAGSRPEEIAQAEETVKKLQEATAFARTDIERIGKLVERGGLPGEAQEKARVTLVDLQSQLASAQQRLEMLRSGPTKTAIAVQEALVKEAEARLKWAQVKFAEGTIVAPFSGVVTKVHVRRGDLATLKSPLLELSDPSSLVIRFAVPEVFTAQVRTGMALEARLDAYPEKVFNGRVARVYPDIDRRIRTRTVEAKIAGIPGVMPGMFARLTLKLKQIDDAVVVPLAALITTPEGGKVVFVVKDGKALRRKVKTGIEASDRIQLLEGVNPGDKVIISGHKDLKDGMDVRVIEPAKQEGKPNPDGASLPSQDVKKMGAGGEK
jgi:multidrug efflux pump subunit AcrA (membrane-fusion protein)